MVDLCDVFESCVDTYNNEPTFQAAGVEVLHSQIGTTDLLAFRGTSDAADAIKDLRAMPWASPVGMTHSGFYKSVKLVWADLLPIIANGRPTILAGHSKGGAEATITAALAVNAGFVPLSLVTFGSPRCGFSQMVRVLKPVPIKRYVNAEDAVPDHPWPLWGYRHPCEALVIGETQGRYDDHMLESGYGVSLGFR